MRRIRPIYAFVAILVAIAIWRAITSPESLGIGVAPDRDCRDFSSQQEAQKFFEANQRGDQEAALQAAMQADALLELATWMEPQRGRKSSRRLR